MPTPKQKMDYDETNSDDELEAELYSRIHHGQSETSNDIVSDPHTFQQTQRTVTKHSIVNNSKMNKKVTTKNRKKAIRKCNLNPFAIASAMNGTKPIPKRLTPYTSYLSQVDSQPIDSPIPSVSTITNEQNNHKPNPFNQCFNRIEERMKRFQLMQTKKSRANKIRENIQQQKIAEEIEQRKNAIAEEIEQSNKEQISIPVPDSDSDDEVYIYPPEEPTVISSDDEDVTEVANKLPETNHNLHDDCDDVNVDYERRLSRRDDPFGGIAASDIVNISSMLNTDSSALPANNSSDHFAKPRRADRHSLKRSYEVSEHDFAATDVYESESSDLPECSVKDTSRQVTTIPSESECSEIDVTKRSKRMRKRKASGSHRGSDHIRSDDSDEPNEKDAAHENVHRPYIFRGEGVYNATSKYSKRNDFAPKQIVDAQPERNHDVAADDSSETNDSVVNDKVDEQQNNKEQDWVVTDQVGDPDDVAIVSLSDVEEHQQNDKEIESNRDEDDANGVRSKTLVIHPEMGWNNEMRAFYNDSWGGETHNALAIRNKMSSK